MIRRRRTGFVPAMLLALVTSMPTAAQIDDELNRPLVKIDGFSVTTLHLALFASQTGREPDQAEEQIRMLNELVNNFIVANSKQGKALETSPEVAAAMQVARARLLAQAFVRDALDKVVIDEQQVTAAYQEQYGGTPGLEYKARHILLNSRDAAVAAIEALDGGADFATLASQHSTGPSKQVGGDLGWFEADQMVEEFAAAVSQLANGSYTREPVKSQFGWHVILREESRELAVPDLASVRDDIEQQLREQRVADMLLEIRQAADVEVQKLDGE
ncbi:MAG: peptidylprolyl isomerase [Gammaproteobacteria bacterium]|nr:peptidylprolyl isomerase [Gammaproteobacteria bacterium]